MLLHIHNYIHGYTNTHNNYTFTTIVYTNFMCKYITELNIHIYVDYIHIPMVILAVMHRKTGSTHNYKQLFRNSDVYYYLKHCIYFRE